MTSQAIHRLATHKLKKSNVGWVSDSVTQLLEKTLKAKRWNFVFAASLLASLICVQNASAQIIIYVSPDANPQTSLEDIQLNPQASVTLTQALAILKNPALRDQEGNPKESIKIHLATGTYRPEETLVIDKEASGSVEFPVIIEGPQDSSALISGGRAINDFHTVTDTALLARLPQNARTQVLVANIYKQGLSKIGPYLRHGIGNPNVPMAIEVFYNHQPMTLARWPNDSFTKIDTVSDADKALTFTATKTNLNTWQNEPELLASSYWFYDWAYATIPIKSIDSNTLQITLTEPKPPYGIKPNQRIFFQNALAELDQAGEWYLDKAQGNLYFWPPKPLQKNDVEVSVLNKLLVLQDVSYIQLNNMTFESTRGDAITVKNGHDVLLANSTIHNIGNRGVVMSGQANGLSHMLIENTGEGGVVLSGGDRQTLKPAGLYVDHSTIRHFGRQARTYEQGVNINGVGNRVVSNQISNAPHSAIQFMGNDHLISQNEIYDVCKETGDAGVIYTGKDWTARGTVIEYNYLHDIAPNIEFGRTKGVYLDDQASGITVRGNLFEKVTEAVFIGGGRDNLIEENVFLNGEFPIHLDARGISPNNDPTTLKERLEAVPYKQTLYKDRYPHLASLLDDEPEKPKYNLAQQNLIIGDFKPRISKDAEVGIKIENMKTIAH